MRCRRADFKKCRSRLDFKVKAARAENSREVEVKLRTAVSAGSLGSRFEVSIQFLRFCEPFDLRTEVKAEEESLCSLEVV